MWHPVLEELTVQTSFVITVICRDAARILIYSPVTHMGFTKYGVTRRDKAERGPRCQHRCVLDAQLHLQVPRELENEIL